MSKLLKPRNVMIEKVAGALAASWYEIGRGQGMTSKWPDAKSYAKNNLEKFIPAAINYLMEMLNNPSFPVEAKEEIYDELIQRANEPSEVIPSIDVKKLIAATANPLDQLLKPTKEEQHVLKNMRPPKAMRH